MLHCFGAMMLIAAARDGAADHLLLREDPRRGRSGRLRVLGRSCSRSRLGIFGHETAYVGFLHGLNALILFSVALMAGRTWPRRDRRTSRAPYEDAADAVIRKDRVRLIVGLVLTLAIVGPLGWMWWNSLLPCVVLRHGHGRTPTTAEVRAAGSPGEHHDMEGMAHGSSGVSVAVLDTAEGASPTSSSTSPPARARCELASGKTVEGYTLNGTSPGPLIEATVGQLVEVRLHNESSRVGWRCTGTASTSPTPRTASPGSPRTP